MLLICLGDAEDGERPDKAKSKGRDGKGGKSKKSAAEIKAAAKRARHATLSYRLHKKVFGWMEGKFKINGKKLVPNDYVIWKFMVWQDWQL